MVKINVFELKARLSEYLKKVHEGEAVVIYRHKTPVATLTRVAEAPVGPRIVGPMTGAPVFDLPASFFEPLAEAELADWEGRAVPVADAPTPRRKAARPRAARTSKTAARPARKTSRRRA